MVCSVSNTFPGNYQVTVEVQGFRKWSGRLELQVQQVAVLDPALEVGDVSTTVEVQDVTPVIALESSSIGTVTDTQRIRQLPLDGRNILNLLQLTPGVQAGGGSPRTNGLKAGSAEFTQDGTSIVDRMSGGAPRITPALDTVEEFRIDMSSAAQYSRPTTVSILTRSGTNSLHGSLFETHRNNSSGLRTRRREEFEDPSKLVRNEFGVSAGGPIVLPGYSGRGRSFWFFSYEGERRREGVTRPFTVPSEAMWNGNYQGLADAQGNGFTIYDPLTTDASGRRQPFADNSIPVSRGTNPMFDYLKANTPRPTIGVSPSISENWIGPFSEPHDDNSYAFKLDHRFSDSNMISGRFTIADSNDQGFICCDLGPPAPDLAYNYQRTKNNLYSGSINHQYIFSPTTINEFVLSGQRSASLRGGGREDVKWAEVLGIANPLNEYGFPTLTARGGGARYTWDSENKSPEYLNAITIEDNLTMVRGKHEFKVGFKARDERNNTRGAQQGQGRYGFGEGWTGLYDPDNIDAVPFTGIGLASMQLGLGEYFAVQYNRPFWYTRQREYGAYVQDTWKLSPRLTLNYGLRYDLWTPYNEASSRFQNLDIDNFATTHQVITPKGHPMESLGVPPSLLTSYAAAGLEWTTADQAGFPDRLMKADRNNFSPRIGAAYRINDRTVLRGSYGLYTWTTPLSQFLLQSLYSVPFRLRYENNIYRFDDVNDWFDYRSAPVPGVSITDEHPVDITSQRTVASPFTFVPWDVNHKESRVQMWNLTFERELMTQTSLRLSYIGNHGSDLDQGVNLNDAESEFLYTSRTGQLATGSLNERRLNPFWDTLNYRTHIGYSNSHSLQAEIQRRYSNGLAFQWFYVFSRNLSTTDAEGYASGPGDYVPDPHTVLGTGSQDDLLRLLYNNVGSIPKHQVRWNAIYDLPFGRGQWIGKNAGKALNAIIGGWQIATIGSIQSGSWLNPSTDFWLTGDPRLSSDERPIIDFGGTRQMLYFRGNLDTTGIPGLANYTPGITRVGPGQDNRVPLTLSDGSTGFVPYDVYNSMPRNFIEGPGSWGADLSLFKRFTFRETTSLRFSVDFFNAFNHPIDVNPDAETGLIDLSRQANGPRTIQFGLRLDF